MSQSHYKEPASQHSAELNRRLAAATFLLEGLAEAIPMAARELSGSSQANELAVHIVDSLVVIVRELRGVQFGAEEALACDEEPVCDANGMPF